MIVNKLKEIAELFDWTFSYGSLEWQNIEDLPDDIDLLETDELQAAYFMLLYTERQKIFSDFNILVSEKFSGEFILAERSNFNQETYSQKYEDHILKMKNNLDKFTDKISDCDNLFIENWKEVEVINQLDTNVDGIKVSFTIRHDK